MTSPESHTLILSIDYGESRSGFSYSLMETKRLDNTSPPYPVIIQDCFIWPDVVYPQGKTATALYYPPGSSVPDAWGKGAFMRYFECREGHLEVGTRRCLSLRDPVSVVMIHGFEVPAVKVVSDYLCYLFAHFQKVFEESSAFSVVDYQQSGRFRVVFTVPDTRDKIDVSLLKEAFLNTGITISDPDQNILFIVESEAGLLDILSSYYPDGNMEPSEIFICVDAGGSSVHYSILSPELKNGRYHFSQPAPGTDNRLGGDSIDSRYIFLIQKKIEAFGGSFNISELEKTVLAELWKPYKHSIIDMNPISVQISEELGKQNEGFDFVTLDEEKRYLLELNQQDIEWIFQESFNAISSIVEGILNHLVSLEIPKEKVSLVLLGGLGNLPLLKTKMNEMTFRLEMKGGLKSKNNSETSVSRGGIFYGIYPNITKPFTLESNIGLAITKLFDPNFHPLERSISINGISLLDGCYFPVANQGIWNTDQTLSYTFIVVNLNGQNTVAFNFFKSLNNDPFCDDHSAILQMSVPVTPGVGRKMRLDVYISENLLNLDVVDIINGSKTSAKLQGSLEGDNIFVDTSDFIFPINVSNEKFIEDTIDKLTRPQISPRGVSTSFSESIEETVENVAEPEFDIPENSVDNEKVPELQPQEKNLTTNADIDELTVVFLQQKSQRKRSIMKCRKTNSVSQILERHVASKLKIRNIKQIIYTIVSTRLDESHYDMEIKDVYDMFKIKYNHPLYIKFEFPTAIGIDLGTTNSVCAIWNNGFVQTLAHGGMNSVTHPSIVGFVDNEDILVSWDAYGEDGTIIYDSKRILGRRYDDALSQREIEKKGREGLRIVAKGKKLYYQILWNSQLHEIPPELIAGKILENLKKTADSFLSREEVRHCVITVPANFDPESRIATIKAAEHAGLSVLRLITEPTAAAIAYCDMQTKSSTWDGKTKKRILLFDLGGGTTDVTILTVGKNVYHVESSKGLPYFGGRNFDDTIVEAFKMMVENNYPEININTLDEEDHRSLRYIAEKAKKKVNIKKSFSKKVIIDGVTVPFSITRDKFAELTKEHVNTCLKVIDAALKEAKIKKEDIDWIVPVGGGSNMVTIKEALETYFEKSMPPPWMPGEAIARGAALVASGLEVKISERLSTTLGVAQRDNKMKRLLRRGTLLPAVSEPLYLVTKFGQKKWAKVELWAGESEFLSKNSRLNMFKIQLQGLGKGEEKVKIRVRVDENGIVTVYAESENETVKESIYL
eukprot:TRINITY_DN3685_c0_g1_i1.p1 TRINITY_DN3685_c0_g1~~TRINITY_DN3685_c0_g1_i1.p1  ORF type:complete len:1274 (-),score=318.40 TRINITY_DN3685_c0_g1_i1:36-3752(-)